MDLYALIICIFFLILSIVFFKSKPLHPTIVFFGLYSFILLMSHLNLYGMIKPSDKAYSLIILMLCSYAVGSLFSFFPTVRFHSQKALLTKTKTHQLDLKLFYTMTIIAILFLLYDFIIVVKHVFNGVPLWQVRNWALADFTANNPIMSNRSFLGEFFRTVILLPIGMSIPPIAAYTFFDSKLQKEKKKILILSLIHVLLTCTAGGGGRLRIIYFCGCFIIAYLLFSDKKHYQNFKKSKYKKYIILIVFFTVCVILLVTTIRLGVGYLWKQIYKYFALPPTLLSIWLPSIENVSPTYGILSFYGVVGYFFRALKMIGMNFMVPQAYDDAYQYILQAQIFRGVGYGVANAYVTPVYYLIIDGGKIFLCLITVLLSAFASRIHKKIKTKSDIYSFSVYAMVMYGVFETFMTIVTAVPAHIITFFMIYFLCRKHTSDS